MKMEQYIIVSQIQKPNPVILDEAAAMMTEFTTTEVKIENLEPGYCCDWWEPRTL